jgi:WD40 repeat protein
LEVPTGKVIHLLEGKSRFAHGVAFSPDGKLLAAGRAGFSTLIWDASTGEQVRELPWPAESLAFLPDGKTLVGVSRNDCRLFDASSGKELHRWPNARTPLALSADGGMLLLGGSDSRLHLWNLLTRTEVRRLDVAKLDEVRIGGPRAAFSPDGKMLAFGQGDDQIRVWEVATGRELYHSVRYSDLEFVNCLAFSPDSQTLAVGIGSRIHLWEAATGKDKLPRAGPSGQIGDVAFAPDNKAVITQTQNETILWDPIQGRQLRRFDHKKQVFFGFSTEGDWVVLRGDGSICRWDPASDRTYWKCEGSKSFFHKGADNIETVALLENGKWLTTSGENLILRLCDTATGKELWQYRRTERVRRVPGDVGQQWPLRFTPDGRALASRNEDGTLRFRETATGKELRCYDLQDPEIALSPDCKLAVTRSRMVVSADGHGLGGAHTGLLLWNLFPNGKARPHVLSDNSFSPAVFSADGRLLAATDSHKAYLFETASGKELCSFDGHRGWITCASPSPDNRMLVTGSRDLTALVWDTTGFLKQGKLRPIELSPDELEGYWKELASPNATHARQSLWKLVAGAKQAVPFLKERLTSASLERSQRMIQSLIDQLGSPHLKDREKATAELAGLVHQAELALKKALVQSSDLEVRRRIERLLEKLEVPITDPERLRVLRAVEVLEQIGNLDAQQTLNSLAQGASDAQLIQDAKMSLERLKRRSRVMHSSDTFFGPSPTAR